MVELQEGAAGADGADGPDDTDGPPGRPGEAFDLFHCPIPKAAAFADVAAAHGERLVEAVVQRGHPGHLQVCVGLGSE